MSNEFDLSEDVVELLAVLPEAERAHYLAELLGEAAGRRPHASEKVQTTTADEERALPSVASGKRPQPKVNCCGCC